MNDLNGLMYHDGKYHMIYQWGKKIRHGGYATSKDLLHWKDEGVALIPQDSFLPKEAARNVSGSQVYSGSGVVVSGDVAEKITGSPKEALVAISDSESQRTFELTSQGESIQLTFRPRFYQKHHGYSYFEPWTYKIWEGSLTGYCTWWAYKHRFTQQTLDTMLAVFTEKRLPDFG